MPRYTTSLGSAINGIGNMMMKGRGSFLEGEQAANRDALTLGQMENLSSQIATRNSEEDRKRDRHEAQRRLSEDPEEQMRLALMLNGKDGGLARQVLAYRHQQIAPQAVDMPVVADGGAIPVSAAPAAVLPAGITESDLGRLLRTQGMLSAQYGLTGNTNAAQFANAMDDQMGRADYETALTSPLALTMYNAAQAARDGDLYSDAGDGLTLTQADGTQLVGNPEMFEKSLGKIAADIAQSQASAENSRASATKTRWEMNGGDERNPVISGPYQSVFFARNPDGSVKINRMTMRPDTDGAIFSSFLRWAASAGVAPNNAGVQKWVDAGRPTPGRANSMDPARPVQPLVPATNPDLQDFMARYQDALKRGQLDYARELRQRAVELHLIPD